MMRELFEYCLTPASFRARASGYLYEAIAFESRAHRNQKHWRPHWDLCHQMVEKFFEEHSAARQLVIYGSGCLFEVPKEKLSQRFERIVLVDQVFPRSVRAWSASQNSKVELVTCDLSREFPRVGSVDLALSANLLSQLSLHRLEQKSAIEQKHLRDLKTLNCPVLLWSDFVKKFTDVQTGKLLYQEATVSFSLPAPLQKWRWDLAPAPECDATFDVSLEMSAHVL